MMLLICDRRPEKAVKYLVENTKPSYVFKQLLELCQLICSTGISDIYKPVRPGKELRAWILKHKLWVCRYMNALWFEVIASEMNVKPRTLADMRLIYYALYDSCPSHKRCSTPKTAIFRYKKEYKSVIRTNSEIPIDVCVECYQRYLEWKFKKEEN